MSGRNAPSYGSYDHAQDALDVRRKLRERLRELGDSAAAAFVQDETPRVAAEQQLLDELTAVRLLRLRVDAAGELPTPPQRTPAKARPEFAAAHAALDEAVRLYETFCRSADEPSSVASLADRLRWDLDDHIVRALHAAAWPIERSASA